MSPGAYSQHFMKKYTVCFFDAHSFKADASAMNSADT